MKSKQLSFFLRSPSGVVAIVVIVIAVVFSGYYFYNKYQETQKLLQNPTTAAQQQVNSLVDKVGKLMVLPNELPTLAKVSNATQARKQPLFKNVENGDEVLFFVKAKLAVVYRPSINKIIAVGPINLTQRPTPTPTQERKVTIVVYNGTTTVGLGTQTQKQLSADNQNITVTDVQNAKKNTYTKTLVIDLNGKNQAIASTLASQLKGETAALPEGETKPSADILVIVGR